jgi:hypothetical protein
VPHPYNTPTPLLTLRFRVCRDAIDVIGLGTYSAGVWTRVTLVRDQPDLLLLQPIYIKPQMYVFATMKRLAQILHYTRILGAPECLAYSTNK